VLSWFAEVVGCDDHGLMHSTTIMGCHRQHSGVRRQSRGAKQFSSFEVFLVIAVTALL
jgi:hypothetical protein